MGQFSRSDLEHRKRVEKALHVSEHSLRLVIDSIPGFVWTDTIRHARFPGGPGLGATVCNRSKIGTLKGWRHGKVSALPTLIPTPVGAYDGSLGLSSQDSSTRVDVDCAQDF